MKNIITRHGRKMLLAMTVICFASLLGGASQARADGFGFGYRVHTKYPDRYQHSDRYGYIDQYGYYHRYEYYNNHRGYWRQRSGARFWINID